MEIDTGSSKSIVSYRTLKRSLPSFSRAMLSPCHVQLRDYQGNYIPTLGQVSLFVEYDVFAGSLPLVVVSGSLPSLLGLNWFQALGLSVAGVHAINCTDSDVLYSEYADVFSDQLGKYVGKPISLNLDPQVAPIRLKPRRVPFALKHRVDAELDKLISQGILEPTDHARWETPIVIPLRPDGSLRICGDYKCTINKALQSHSYPVPIVQHLLHSLGEGTIFAKLDMAQAYQQLPVDKDTAEALTIVTHRGAFKCNRLQFGVSVAPGLFQNLMERLLSGLPGVIPYFDDVLVSANGKMQLLSRVRSVLSRFRQAGLKLKRSKCQIGVPSVEFLGYKIDAHGIHPTPSKVAAIKQAPPPSNKAELQAFLGLLNFYSVFLPHKATIAEPLHRLLDAHRPWDWGPEAQASFHAVKQLLMSDAVLVQYNHNLPVTLAADASPYGIGAVLSHLLPNGSEAPIAYFSRTLSSAERNYSQTDKEALALVASVKKFHDYLYGRPFRLYTDHKPLLGILAGDRQTPQFISPRMSRWAEFLSAYSYSLFYKPGKSLSHADALSRCPLPISVQDPAPASEVLLVEELGNPLSASDIAHYSARDPVLRQVLDWVRRGWPREATLPAFGPYKSRQDELSALNGCLLWGSRVVIPPPLRETVLQLLHEAHPGIVRMKALGRSYVWWPGLDKAIEAWVSHCHACQSASVAPPVSPPRDWESPRGPWSRLHVDFAGPFKGHHFLVLVDAYSGWVELDLMTSTTADALIRSLTRWFATHGIPDVLVSDNGPQFTSTRFQLFLVSLGIRQALTAPWHPASNGRAERAVRSVKESLSKFEGGDWQDKIARYLLAQHSTPNPLTNRSPAELLMGRRLRTKLDRVHPQFTQEDPVRAEVARRNFTVGDLVLARNYGGEERWVPASILEITGPVSYRVGLSDGRVWRRHIDQLRGRCREFAQPHAIPEACHEFPLFQPVVSSPDSPARLPASPREPVAVLGGEPKQPLSSADIPAVPGSPSSASLPAATARPTTPPLPRRSDRVRRQPAYLKDYVCTCSVGRGAASWHLLGDSRSAGIG